VSEDTGLKAEYGGKVYYFCSPGCKAEFEANPEKYIGGMGSHSHHGHHMGHRRGGCHHWGLSF